MSEFQQKVDQFKQSFQPPMEEPLPQTAQIPGFTTPLDDGGDTPVSFPQEQDRDNGASQYSQEMPEQSPQEASTRRKKKENSLKKQLQQLRYDNYIKEQKARELEERVRLQEQILSQKQNQVEQYENQSNAYYENNLQTRESSILNELRQAKEEGDLDKEILLSKALAQVTAEQSTYGLYKTQRRQEPSFDEEESSDSSLYQPHYQQGGPPVVFDDYESDDESPLSQWLDQNPWADPDSNQFSQRLRQEVNEFAKELEEHLKYNGQGNLIGTSSYFSALDDIMKDKYGANSSSKSKGENESFSNPVSPVSRSGSSLADQYVSQNQGHSRNRISLSDDEMKIARSLKIKLPNGRYMSEAEAINEYAKNKMNTGGSNKLIIG